MAGFFDTLFGGGAEREAAEKNRALATQYGTDSMGYLKSAYDTGRTDLGSAIGAYSPLKALSEKFGKGGDLYLDALGINGPEGNARASSAFQTNPGYDKGIDAGLDIINRRRGVANMSNSGNADIDALNFAQNNQNQTYKDWLANLSGVGTTGANLAGVAAGGEASGWTNLANLAKGYGSDQAGVAGNVLGGETSANNLQAQGEASGAKNLLGAGLSLATLAMGGAGGAVGGAAGGGFSNSLMGNLFNKAGGLFMGGGSPSGYGR
jgi:hypothetical protein